MAWTLRLSESSKRQLKKLDASSAQTILRYLNRLVLETSDPRERGSGLRANLPGLWRYRIGDYRVICSLEDHELVVLVLQIGHRRDVYK
jgi:mRNA interferase RelE/StbE